MGKGEVVRIVGFFDYGVFIFNRFCILGFWGRDFFLAFYFVLIVCFRVFGRNSDGIEDVFVYSL